MATLTKTLTDGRTLEIAIEVRDNPCGGDFRRPYLVAYLDGAEVAVGDPWHVPAKMRPQYRGSAWVVGGKVGLDEAEGAAVETALEAAREAHRKGGDAALEAACPGLAALKAARDEADRYADGFNRMMEDEGNDGVSPPRRPAADFRALARQYPRASLYLRAEYDSASMSDAVAAGGKAAMRVLAEGGSLEAARDALSAPVRRTAAYLGSD